MKAVVYEEYGPPEVLRFTEVEKPTPGDDEVLIRIRAATLNTGDCEMRRPEISNSIWFVLRLFFGFRKPRKQILGAYLAGEIEAVGKEVEHLRAGDQVYGASGIRFGAYAEYVCLPGTYPIAAKPCNMTYEEAATVPLGGIHALHYLLDPCTRRRHAFKQSPPLGVVRGTPLFFATAAFPGRMGVYSTHAVGLNVSTAP